MAELIAESKSKVNSCMTRFPALYIYSLAILQFYCEVEYVGSLQIELRKSAKKPENVVHNTNILHIFRI